MSADLEFDYKKSLKKLNMKDSEVKELREKLSKIEKVPKSLSSKKLLCFLNACNGVDDAANVMSTYYDIRQKCSTVFHNRDPLSPEIQQCLANQHYFHLPNTPAGHSVIYHCLSSPKASNYVFDEACKTFFMTIDSLLFSRGPSKSLVIIFDMQNIGIKHLMRTKVETLRIFFRYLQEALPAKLEAMHIINCVSFFNTVMSLVKPFMKSEIINKMHLHHGSDYENLHNHVPRSCLPSDFGGELKPIVKLHQKHCQEFARLRNFFVEEEKEARLK